MGLKDYIFGGLIEIQPTTLDVYVQRTVCPSSRYERFPLRATPSGQARIVGNSLNTCKRDLET